MASRWHARTGLVTARYKQPGGATITLKPTEGNFSIGGMNAGNFENIKVMDRTKHDGFVEGPDLVQDITIDLQVPRQVFTDPVLAILFDFFLKKGKFAAEVGVDPTLPASWEFLLNVTDGVTSGQILLPLVEGEFSVAEGAEFYTLSFSGRNHLAPVFS